MEVIEHSRIDSLYECLHMYLYRGTYSICIKVKVKFSLRTGHEGPEEEQMYSSTLPSTSALDGGGWSKPRPGRITPGKEPETIVKETG